MNLTGRQGMRLEAQRSEATTAPKDPRTVAIMAISMVCQMAASQTGKS